MYRTITCGELTKKNIDETVTLSGWVQIARNLGGMTFIDLRDRYGITQLAFNLDWDKALCEEARKIGREWVIQIEGAVIERESKNPEMITGDIEVKVSKLTILNQSITPPFPINTDTDVNEELRMKYRYLDLRNNTLRQKLELRHRISIAIRSYLNNLNFIEVETPVLIKSTPEGARDFVIPSRINQGQFYALPQSPQIFKQLLMVGGFDKYFQIVKCFRDEDLRADRQPEFTQIDCEMSFVEQQDVLQTFEGMIRNIFKYTLNVDFPNFPKMTYADAMKYYGNDKPDTRFDMKFVELKNPLSDTSTLYKSSLQPFSVFEQAESVIGICATGAAHYTRKQLDELTEFVKQPKLGASGLVYFRYAEDGTIKSSVDKFFSEADLKNWSQAFNSKPGDLILILAGPKEKTQKALSELRLEMGSKLGLRKKNVFAPLWIVDFPLLEWNEGDTNLLASLAGRWHSKHHPFTSPLMSDVQLLKSNPAEVRANAYDMVINGVEVGGGSIRIHDKILQNQIFETLGFTKEETQNQFGFLLNAFEYGAPPHGGIAFGFDRLCSLIGGVDSIRDFIAFPKNNMGRDMMMDSPSNISEEQLNELKIKLSN